MSSSNTSYLTDLDVRVLVLAGGSSSRFMPLNKVFVDLGTGRTLIQQTFDRACSTEIVDSKPLTARDKFYIATGPDMASLMREQLPDIPPSNVISDPAPRNTLPAILWAIANLQPTVSDDTLIAMLTGDHVIDNTQQFRKCVERALSVASLYDSIVTIGITPSDDPNDWTSFGAMKEGMGCIQNLDASELEQFLEKPTKEMAEGMISEGGWFWNAGMFFFSIKSIEKGLSHTVPEVYEVYKQMKDLVSGPGIRRIGDAKKLFENFQRKIPHPLYPGTDRLADNSIDYALMQPLTNIPIDEIPPIRAYVIPGDFPWTDIGSWDALYKVVDPDDNDNIVVGTRLSLNNVRNCLILGEESFQISAYNCTDLVIVHSKEGVLFVCSKDYLGSKLREVYTLFKSKEPLANLEFKSQNCTLMGDNIVVVGCEGLAIENGPDEAIVNVRNTM
ncbi:hypothetical protein PCE1_002977 [Barthelona sp. PCE]